MVKPENEKEEAWVNYLLYLYDLATEKAPLMGVSHREGFADISLLIFRLSSIPPEQQEIVLRLMKGDKDSQLLEMELNAMKEGKIHKG
jgi:hypothetical protein